jgi:thiamine-monophosphate kinase
MTDHNAAGEFDLIGLAACHGLVRPEGVVCGIGDDCAVLSTDADQVLLVTTDTMVEDIHFLGDAPLADVGYKLLAVSLSDIAAMGGEPRDAVVSIALKGDGSQRVAVVNDLYEGLYACCEAYGTNIVGGDTVRTKGPLTLGLTLTGRAAATSVCYRKGARPGDAIYVTGTLGDAAAGLGLLLNRSEGAVKQSVPHLKKAHADKLVSRHRRPVPRVALGQALGASGAITAMIDLSDGIASDLQHICSRSGVSAVLEAARIPVSPQLTAYQEAGGDPAQELALSGGEDYELLFTTAPDQAERINELASDPEFPQITRVGRIESGPAKVTLVRSDGTNEALSSTGFDHFRQS